MNVLLSGGQQGSRFVALAWEVDIQHVVCTIEKAYQVWLEDVEL